MKHETLKYIDSPKDLLSTYSDKPLSKLKHEAPNFALPAQVAKIIKDLKLKFH